MKYHIAHLAEINLVSPRDLIILQMIFLELKMT